MDNINIVSPVQRRHRSSSSSSIHSRILLKMHSIDIDTIDTSNKTTLSSFKPPRIQQNDNDSTPKQNNNGKNNNAHMTKLGLFLLLACTFLSYPSEHYSTFATWHDVWWYGWLTALATGIGALPFYVVREIQEYWLGICNALAAGMMLAATCCLCYEGYQVPIEYAIQRLMCGIFVGILFISGTKRILDSYEDIHIADLDAADTRQVLLIMAVMTLHSISEGIGIGVSFGGNGGGQRGLLVSLTLAIHNIPEGLAISLVLIPKKVSISTAALWSVISSLPQPIFALPAFIFVQQCQQLLPAGLGFAGGAMALVAVQELLPESVEKTGDKRATGGAALMSFLVMLTVQVVLKGEI